MNQDTFHQERADALANAVRNVFDVVKEARDEMRLGPDTMAAIRAWQVDQMHEFGFKRYMKQAMIVFARQGEPGEIAQANSDGQLDCQPPSKYVCAVLPNGTVCEPWFVVDDVWEETYAWQDEYVPTQSAELELVAQGLRPAMKVAPQWLRLITENDVHPDVGYVNVWTLESTSEARRAYVGDYLSVGAKGEMWPIEAGRAHLYTPIE